MGRKTHNKKRTRDISESDNYETAQVIMNFSFIIYDNLTFCRYVVLFAIFPHQGAKHPQLLPTVLVEGHRFCSFAIHVGIVKGDMASFIVYCRFLPDFASPCLWSISSSLAGVFGSRTFSLTFAFSHQTKSTPECRLPPLLGNVYSPPERFWPSFPPFSSHITQEGNRQIIVFLSFLCFYF